MSSPDASVLASLAIVAAFGALASVPFWTRRLAGAAWIDPPRADRHSIRAVPRTGGAGWITAWALGAGFATVLGVLSSVPGLLTTALVALAFLLGVLDDRGWVGPAAKASLALLLLALFLFVSRAWVDFGAWSPGESVSGIADGVPVRPLRWLFVLGVAAAIQLAFQVFDNLDGVAGAVALVGTAHIAAGAGSSELAVLGAVGAGASLGFLGWNRPPASVYLGNAGSQAVGLLCAGLVGSALLRSPTPGNGLAVVLPFAWPLFDLVFVVFRRLRARRRPWVGDRGHTTHLLAQRLGGDRPVFLVVVGATLLLAGVARFVGR